MHSRTYRAIQVVTIVAVGALAFYVPGDTCAADCPVADLSGDCKVDLADLAVLAGQWLQGPHYPAGPLEAHWTFDEAEGDWAWDASGRQRHAQLRNGPTRGEGVARGAILLDGVNDYAEAPFVVDPAAGPLSAFAWIKGGNPREVILAQSNGTGTGREWLQIDTTNGTLLTRLTDGGSILTSQTVVTDGAWHHVGVVWDGSRRTLYVDGEIVAQDAEPLAVNLQACDGGMTVGTGKLLVSDTCWEGWIDDVRIYGRALSAEDVGLLASAPGATPPEADLDGTDGIDMADFAVLAYYWLKGHPGEYRCIWVDSWYWNPSFMNPTQAQELIQTCRENNINTVIVEVRKVGDAAYNSNIEPRIESWISGGPSFDPLGYLIDLAHDTSGGKPYIEVHAWFVAQRILKADTPYHKDHVLSVHPEYAMEDVNGNKIVDNGYYLDPGHPGAVDWNVAVILDCLRNYDIDGINLDYIRYPGSTWGYNPISVARFNTFTGRSGKPSASDPAWCDWRRECLTLQVKKIYVQSLKLNPWVVLTTDTINWGCAFDDYERSSPYVSVFQDWVGWLRSGIIDYNTLMGYVCQSCTYEPCAPITNPERYQGWCNLSLDNDDKRGSILSTGAYMQRTVQDAMDQLLWARQAGAAGLNIYDWYSEVSRNEAGETRADFYRALRNQVFPEWVDPPIPDWKARPTTGIVEGTITEDGAAVDHAVVEIAGLTDSPTHSDGSGWYGILEVPPGVHTLVVSVGGAPVATVPVTVPAAGDIVTVDVELNR